MPAIFSIIGLALNLMGVIVLFRYGMPYPVRTEGATGSATVLDVEHHINQYISKCTFLTQGSEYDSRQS